MLDWRAACHQAQLCNTDCYGDYAMQKKHCLQGASMLAGGMVRVGIQQAASLSVQASIAVGELGVSRTDPDAPTLDVLTDVLNGFGGSLFNQIRSRQVSCHGPSAAFCTIVCVWRAL